MRPRTLYPAGRDAKEGANIVLFTPGKGIKAREEQRQGKRILSKGQKKRQSGLATHRRGQADKRQTASSRASRPLGMGTAEIGCVAPPFSCLPTLGFYVSSTPLPSRLCTTLPGKRRIILALLQHFLHDGSCQIPFQGCVGWVCSTRSIIGQSRISLHIQAHENLLNLILLSEKLNRLMLSRIATGEQKNK